LVIRLFATSCMFLDDFVVFGINLKADPQPPSVTICLDFKSRIVYTTELFPKL